MLCTWPAGNIVYVKFFTGIWAVIEGEISSPVLLHSKLQIALKDLWNYFEELKEDTMMSTEVLGGV